MQLVFGEHTRPGRCSARLTPKIDGVGRHYSVSQKKFPKRWRHPCRDVVANPQVCPTFFGNFF